MRKRITGLVLAGALGLGTAGTALVVAPAAVSAATSESSAAQAVSDRVERIQEALSGLVNDGSITQEQADEVATTLAEQLPGRGHGGPGGGLGGGRILESAATVLDTTVEDLRTALEGGQSLADVAAEQGVDTETLVDELVEAAVVRLDEKVEAGELTETEADAREAELTERVTELVEREGLPVWGGHGGRHAPRSEGTEQAPAPETDTSSSGTSPSGAAATTAA